MEKNKENDLMVIPGVGKRIAQHLRGIGITCVEDLKGRDPEELYTLDCLNKGFQEDRCQLYVFRCAVYYAEHEQPEPEKLKWWYWKEKEYPEKEQVKGEKMLNMEEINTLVGTSLCNVWTNLCAAIDEKYDMENLWNRGGKAWDYEYKYRRGGKTLCALYAKEGCVGFMVIFGKAEREKFENVKMEFSEQVRKIYDEAKTYHDGKWMMFLPEDTSMFGDFMKLLEIKRKPNRK